MSDYSIRAVTKADEPFLWEMLYQAIHVPEGVPAPPREIIYEPKLARYVKDWGVPGDYGLVALVQETQQPVGATWLRLLVGEEGGYGYVDDQTPELNIAVLPEYRGKGFGTALLKQLLTTARENFPAVSLSVSPTNPAMELYKRLGFEVVGESGTSLIMLKKFTTED